MATVHIIGTGVAGLACAVRLVGRGCRIALWEAAPGAGGRCRSFFDASLGRRIDNGNHLLLSANRAVLSYLDEIGAADTLIRPDRAAFPFVDLASGAHWTVRPNDGPLPWWVLVPSRRIPGTRAADYLSGLRLFLARADATVGQCFPATDPLFRSFWEPLTLAALNLEPAAAAAAPLRAVIAETFARGGAWCRPMIARDGLSDSLVEPALRRLAAAGVVPAFGHRLRGLRFDDGRVAGLDFGEHRVALEPEDRVVLAVPAAVARPLLPGVTVPDDGTAIVNAHFRLAQPIPPPDGIPFVGLIGGAAHWVFLRGDLASVTVSGAGALADQAAPALATLLWHDVARAFNRDTTVLPPYRIIKERRATFVQTPENLRRRPGVSTRWRNLFLAGDWTATGLPATIEGAVRSGHSAASASGCMT
ncbi:MAG: NAD(P)-binding protein [Azospirillum sp.]|nr:NAD(P)-binding protein [Azospirillum sp.]